MALDRSIFLIGYRGTGKTTVARVLSARLGCSWVDSDELVQRRGYRTIAEIFAEDGEQAFRDLEQEVVVGLCRETPKVVALGGGAVLRDANRQGLAGHHVVWLKASPATLAARLAADERSASQRPSLTGAGVLAEIEQVLAERTPMYHECATIELDTENRSPEAVAEDIYRQLTGPEH